MQGTRKAVLLGVVGGFGGLFAWLVARPYIHTVDPNSNFTYGSFFGWFAHLILGATIAGFLAFLISLGRTDVPRALLAFGVGMVIGGPLVCGADAGSDLLWMHILTATQGHGFTLPHLFWNIAVSMALTLSVAAATQPTKARFKRAIIVGLIAGVVGYVLISIVSTFLAIGLLSQMLATGIKNFKPPDKWGVVMWAYMVDEVGIGIVVGVMMGLSDIVRRQAWIRVIFGRNEVRDFPMEEGPNRIGSAEGIEVRLPRDPKLSDVHAALHQTPSGWYLADNNSATGTFLNRSPVQQSYIQNGDEIKAGPYTMLFFIASSPRGFVITRPFLAAIDPPKEVETKQQPELRPRLVDAFGKVSNLAAGASTIGRGEASTISVSYDRTVSRSHAQINLGAGRAVIQDLHSTHGTLVNGEPISVAVTLADGDKIKVGNTLFEYHQ